MRLGRNYRIAISIVLLLMGGILLVIAVQGRKQTLANVASTISQTVTASPKSTSIPTNTSLPLMAAPTYSQTPILFTATPLPSSFLVPLKSVLPSVIAPINLQNA
jgi:hypothetical protein